MPEVRPEPLAQAPETVAAGRVEEIIEATLAWYDHQRRILPWRFPPGVTADPYHVWLSEIMLQQTTVKAVVPYFLAFVARWPTVEALATADEEDVLQAWAGLGYYSRARNLHACARYVARELGGQFPTTAKALQALPGVGPYTAAAIAAIAFEEAVTPLDGNIERVFSRLHAVETPLPASKPELRRIALAVAPKHRPGDFAQALMDLGATVCTPKRPSCLMCPLQRQCEAHARGQADVLPRKAPKQEKPSRYGAAFVVMREDGAVLLRKREPRGLLAGMLEVPTSDWGPTALSQRDALKTAPVQGRWLGVAGGVDHTFTHFRLRLDVYQTVVPKEIALTIWADSPRCRWVARGDLNTQALPSLMRKVLAAALDDNG
ncbi:MAG: A/G-specific adenine glycosylase [Hyphomicrobiaceae bacterium]